MRAVNAGDLDTALRGIDESHAQLLRDRDTVEAVTAAVGALTVADDGTSPPRGSSWTVGEVARRLGVSPATLRTWERTGLLVPVRDRATGYRRYGAADVRDAELAHLLRRGGYPLQHIATVLAQVRAAGGAEPLAASLAAWRQRLTDRSWAMLAAAGQLHDYLAVLATASEPVDGRTPATPGSTAAGQRSGPPL
jgi:DNA-binding transcriptional MerR regulator